MNVTPEGLAVIEMCEGLSIDELRRLSGTTRIREALR
jgi:hypothetical protein